MYFLKKIQIYYFKLLNMCKFAHDGNNHLIITFVFFDRHIYDTSQILLIDHYNTGRKSGVFLC